MPGCTARWVCSLTKKSHEGDIGLPVYQVYMGRNNLSLASLVSQSSSAGHPVSVNGLIGHPGSVNGLGNGHGPVNGHPSLSSRPSGGQLVEPDIREDSRLGYPALHSRQNGHNGSGSHGVSPPPRDGRSGYPSLPSRSNIRVYNQLQVPSYSNGGSMKRGRGYQYSGPASLAAPGSLPDIHQDGPQSVQYTPHVIQINNNKPTKV